MSDYHDLADSVRQNEHIAREHARGYDDVEYLDGAYLITMLIGVLALAAVLWLMGKP